MPNMDMFLFNSHLRGSVPAIVSAFYL